MGAPLQNCHWSINDNFPKHHWHLLLYKTVIDQSMTVLKGIKTCPWVHLYRNCHWSMTFFKSVIDQWQFLKLSLIDQWQFLKLSLIDQWQFWKVSRPVHGCTFTESVIDQWHFWKLSLINDIFCKGAYMDRSRYLSKLSLIDQWQFL